MKDVFVSKKREICIFFPVFAGLVYLFLCLMGLNRAIDFDETTAVSGDFLHPEYFLNPNLSPLVSYGFPPLYPLIVKIWSIFFGANLPTIRIISTFFGIFTILLCFKYVNRFFKTKAACISTLLLAIMPFFVILGSKAGCFTMMTAFFIGSIFSLQLFDKEKKRGWLISYIIFTSLGFWTHYLFLAVVVAQICYLIIRKKAKFILVTLIPLASFAPCIPLAIASFRFKYNLANNIDQDASITWFQDATPEPRSLIDFWSESLIFQPGNQLGFVSSIILVIIFIAFILALYKNRKKLTLAILCLVLLLTFAELIAITHLAPFPPSQCLICATILIPISFGIVLAQKIKSRTIFASAFIGTALLQLCGTINLRSDAARDILERSDADRLYADICALTGPNEIIAVYEDKLLSALSYYNQEYSSDPESGLQLHSDKTPSYQSGKLKPEEASEDIKQRWILTDTELSDEVFAIEAVGQLNYSKSYYLYKLRQN